MSSKKNLYFALYKPYKVLSQFSDEDGNKGLNSIIQVPKDVYPVGRLDLDSEGLLILTNNKRINHALLDPRYQHERTYWVQVEGKPSVGQIRKLCEGVKIKVKGESYSTREAGARLLNDQVDIGPRQTPVNEKKYSSTSWLEIKLKEGKNRQVRKMTAAIGHPTLRLIRVAVEELSLFPLRPGELRQISEKTLIAKLHLKL